MSFGPIAMIAATALSVVGTLVSARAQSKAAEFNARVAADNADLARQASNREEERQRRESARKMSALAARAGKSGVTMSGSLLEVVEESARNAELDALNIRMEGAQREYNFLTQSSLATAEAKNAKTSGYISAAGALTGGAYNYWKAGY
jgi:uncharacterized protein involved in type VI secretion and phage assembly